FGHLRCHAAARVAIALRHARQRSLILPLRMNRDVVGHLTIGSALGVFGAVAGVERTENQLVAKGTANEQHSSPPLGRQASACRGRTVRGVSTTPLLGAPSAEGLVFGDHAHPQGLYPWWPPVHAGIFPSLW